MSLTLYIGNLARDVNTSELRKLFAKYGNVTSIEPKGGFAFIEMESRRACDDAIYGLDGIKLFGNTLRVEFAKSEPDRRYAPPAPAPPDACFKCGGIGHFARDCPSADSSRRRPEQPSSRVAGDSYRPASSSSSRYRDVYDPLMAPPHPPTPSRYHHLPPPMPYDRYPPRRRPSPPDYGRYGRYDPLPPPIPRGHDRDRLPPGRPYERRRTPPPPRYPALSYERRPARMSRRPDSPDAARRRLSRSPPRRAPRTPSPRR